MNKTELVEKIAAGANLSKADAKKALDATVAALKDALVAGDKIQLVGFGTFSVNERPAREGINPATKQKIAIAAKKVAKFKAGAELADAGNKNPGLQFPKIFRRLHGGRLFCGVTGGTGVADRPERSRRPGLPRLVRRLRT